MATASVQQREDPCPQQQRAFVRAPHRGDAIERGQRRVRIAARRTAPRSRSSRRHATSTPIAVLTSTNWPATAGRTAAIQRASPRAARPTMPKKACAAASSSARISANWPSSGIIVVPLRRTFGGGGLSLSDFATSGGMYFSSCLARISSATKVPLRACGRARPRPALRGTGPAGCPCSSPARCA